MPTPILSFEAKSSRTIERAGNAPSGLRRLSTPHGVMTRTALDPDLILLVVQINTRIGMIMEDVSLVALDATTDRLEALVREISVGLAAI
jgi:hypothetical protein